VLLCRAPASALKAGTRWFAEICALTLVLALTVAVVLIARGQQERVPIRVDVCRLIRQPLLRARAANIS
jgi:hypothetical protein